MNPVEQNAVAEEGSDTQIEWEMRPGGMLVQRRENGGDEDGGPFIKIRVSYGSSFHEFTVPWQSTFGELKKLLAPKTGLEPGDQRLYFRGREKDDTETLHMAGLKDLSKLLLMEHHSSKERKMEEARKKDEISKACEAVAEVRAEVDKLSEKVSSLQASVNGGTKMDEKEFIISTELLMVQLLKLDSIEAEGEAKTQRKNEVRRVQSYVDALDALKTKNANPFGTSFTNSVSVSTNWETFDSGVGSLTPPSVSSSSAKITQNWEQFE